MGHVKVKSQQRSPQTEKRARLRRRHTEPPGTRFAAIHSRIFVHLRLILCAQESEVWTTSVCANVPRASHRRRIEQTVELRQFLALIAQPGLGDAQGAEDGARRRRPV